MRSARAKSALVPGARRRPSVLFDIDEDNVSYHMDSPSALMTALGGSPEAARERRTQSAAPAASAYLRRTIDGEQDNYMADPSLAPPPQLAVSKPSAPPPEPPGAHMYEQALHNSKLEVPVEPPPPEFEYSHHQRELRRRRNRSRARSRKQSIYSRWTYCGVTFSNAVLRVLTAAVLVPAVVLALLYAPALAVAHLTAVVLCLGAYEFSWLAYRIHYQLIVTYDWYEKSPLVPALAPIDALNAASDQADGAFREASSCGAGIARLDYQDPDVHLFQSFVSGYTQSTTSYTTSMDGYDGWRGGDDDRESFADPLADAEAAAAGAARPKAPSPLELLDLDASPGVIRSLARSAVFRGHVWLARLVTAAVLSTCWSLLSTMVSPSVPFPVKATPRVLEDFPYYFWATDFVAALCAVSTPNVPLAVSLLLQKALFQVHLQNAFNCPLTPESTLACADAPLNPLQTYAIGAMALLLLRALSARSGADLVIGFTLDALGYTYLTGSLGLMASMVNSSDADATFARMWLVMLAVVWVSEFFAYCCDAVMFHFRLAHVRVLPPRLVFTFDVEAAAAAVVAGALVMVFGSQLLDVPGGLLPKILFSAAGVFLGRFGRLLVSLVKKAAGVRWSSRLVPGFGGVLDATNSLLVTSVVFVKFYLYAATLVDGAALADGQQGGTNATSVDFSGSLAASLVT